MLNIHRLDDKAIKFYTEAQREGRDFYQSPLYDLTEFQSKNSISLPFDFNGCRVHACLFPDDELTYHKPFIYLGKELKACFSILQTDTDDILKCELTSLANNRVLELQARLSHGCNLHANCN